MIFVLRWLGKLRIKPLWLVAAVLCGLLLHIGLVLALMHLWPNQAYAALAKLSASNQMIVLEPVSAGHQPLPFLSPAERYALCRFDLRKGPVTINATLGDDDWLIAIYNPSGENVYAISGADLERRDVELVLALRDNDHAASLPIIRDGGITTAVGLSDRTGIAVVEAPSTRTAYAKSTEKLLAQATCVQRAKAKTPEG